MVSTALQEIIRQLQAAQIISRNVPASLTFLTWDICITFDQEVEYIWMKPGTLWSIKTLFLFLRYFPFFVLIVIQTLAHHLRRHIPVPLRICRSFFLFQIIALVMTSIALDAIFMIQVYALYNRRRWVAVAMTSLLALETLSFIIVIPYATVRVKHNPLCYVTVPTHINVAMSLTAFVPPVTAFIFILIKQIIGIRDGWGHTPLMVLLTRDGVLGVLALVAVWVANPLVSIAIGKSLAHIGHLWFMSVVPSIGCRVILNMQHLKAPAEPAPTNGVQLTTEVYGFDTTESESYQLKTLNTQGANHPHPGTLEAEQGVQPRS